MGLLAKIASLIDARERTFLLHLWSGATRTIRGSRLKYDDFMFDAHIYSAGRKIASIADVKCWEEIPEQEP